MFNSWADDGGIGALLFMGFALGTFGCLIVAFFWGRTLVVMACALGLTSAAIWFGFVNSELRTKQFLEGHDVVVSMPLSQYDTAYLGGHSAPYSKDGSLCMADADTYFDVKLAGGTSYSRGTTYAELCVPAAYGVIKGSGGLTMSAHYPIPVTLKGAK